MKEAFFPRKIFSFVFCIIVIWYMGIKLGFNINQLLATLALSLSIFGTLIFWEFRLSFAFLGSTIILFSRVVTLEEFLHLSSMEIIFFLIGMMVLIGFLREIGLFDLILQKALVMQRLSARKILVIMVFASALLACVVDEVSSIIFMVMTILTVCDYFEIKPVPFIIASVLATNIGSAGTVVGNPIGLIIATKAHLTFEDFMRYAFPLMICSLFILIGVLRIVFRKELKELDEKIKLLGPNDFLVKLLSVPIEQKLKIGFIVFGTTLFLIALHHRLELLLGLETNTILLIAPLLSAAIVMVWRGDKARHYIEKDVEWWTLLFFIFLFAQAGIVAKTGVATIFANKLLAFVANNKILLVVTILFGSAVISSVLDNVVVVAAFIPILYSLKTLLNTQNILWWALLFGACFGGNITVIGSTANIMAIGTLEKSKGISIGFFSWLKIGLIVGFITLIFVGLVIALVPYYR